MSRILARFFRDGVDNMIDVHLLEQGQTSIRFENRLGHQPSYAAIDHANGFELAKHVLNIALGEFGRNSLHVHCWLSNELKFFAVRRSK